MKYVRLALFDENGYMVPGYLEVQADLLMLSIQRINQQGARMHDGIDAGHPAVQERP